MIYQSKLHFLILNCLGQLLFSGLSNCDLVRYTFVVEYISGAPDGVYKAKILGINGNFPGPTIEATVGDILQVDVINRIQDGQNTSIHWHGIHQKRTHFEDGTSYITQCPLGPMQTQRYSFPLEQAGTFWYHSHVKSQYTEGLWGALIVHDVSEIHSYDGEIVLSLSDHYHRTAHENEEWHLSPPSRGVPPYPDSGLINGLGRYHCGYASAQDRSCNTTKQLRNVFRVQSNKTYRVRVINTAAYAAFNFSIEGHSLQTIEVDGVPVVKSDKICTIANIATAQRYSFLLRTNNDSSSRSSPKRFLIRSDMRTDTLLLIQGANINKFPEAVQGDITAILEYSDDPQEDFESVKNRCKESVEPHSYLDHVPSRIETNPEDQIVLDEMDLSPLDGVPAPKDFDVNVILEVGFYEDHEDIRRGSFNQTPYQFPPSGKPILMSLLDGEEIPKEVFPIEVGYMQIVQVVINNPYYGPHPFHMHGHHFWVVGLGAKNDGNFDPSRHNENLRLTGPKRDTVVVEELSWAVIRFIADNPGLWTFHCHIDWHNLSGMAATFVVAKDLVMERIKITEEARRICGHQFDTDEPRVPSITQQNSDISGGMSISNLSNRQINLILISVLSLFKYF